MAIDVSKVEVWAGTVQDEPGALARVLEALAEAGADLDGVVARREQHTPGQGSVFITPVKGRKVQEAARQAGLKPVELGTLRVEGSNRAGLGGRLTRAIAEAGINLRGVTALTMGNKFVSFFGFDNDADATAAMRALRGVEAGGRAGGARRGAMTSGRTTRRRGPARAGGRSAG